MDKARLIRLRDYGPDGEGAVICVMERGTELSFPVRRVYWISSGSAPSQHGNHVHLNPEQILVCIRGSAIVQVTDGDGLQEHFELNDATQGLYIPPPHWLVVRLDPGSTLLCLSSLLFSEQKTVHALDEFLNLK